MAVLPSYATREDVKAALDFKETARADARIDRALNTASRTVEGLCHRRFYPEQATRSFDWPNAQRAAPWRLWLDDSELITLDSLTAGGVILDRADIVLEPNRSGPPYTRVELLLSTSAAFGGGSTYQRDISITGLWGYRDDEAPAGTVATAAAVDATSVDVTDSAAIGVGSLLRVGAERLLVTGKSMRATGVTLDPVVSLTAQASDVSVPLSGTSGAPVVGETILLDSERMLVVDVAGAVVTVKRAWDGSVLATHAAGTAIYAPRTLAVERGVLGTTAAPLALGAPVYRWEPPGPVRDLTIAEASVIVMQGPAGWARTAGSGDNQRVVSGRGLAQLRDQVYTSHGRKARIRGV